MYNEKVMEAFKNPKNVGEVENYDGIGVVGNASCGDIMQITIKVENGIITDAKFKPLDVQLQLQRAQPQLKWLLV